MIHIKATRRVGFLFFVLVTDTFLETLGLRLAFMIITPLFVPWFMLQDEKRCTRTRKQQQARYVYRRFP